MSQIDDILDKIEAYSWIDDDEPTIDATTLKEAKSALYDLIDKWVIGGEFYGDDNYRPFLVASRTMPIEENQKQAKITLKARNQLRQQMRNKLKELFDE